jgi:hypothetical protein
MFVIIIIVVVIEGTIVAGERSRDGKRGCNQRIVVSVICNIDIMIIIIIFDRVRRLYVNVIVIIIQ